MKELIDQLKIDLSNIKGIQQVFMNRDAEPTKYPALACIWDSTENTFETNKENFRIANFNLYAIVKVEGKTMKDIDEVIIPKLYDSITDYFDENWNGITAEGHRRWAVVSLANSEISDEDKAKVVHLDCILQIKYLKDN